VSHTYAQNVVHVVFSTKGRHKTMDREFRPNYGPTLRAFVESWTSMFILWVEWKITFIC